MAYVIFMATVNVFYFFYPSDSAAECAAKADYGLTFSQCWKIISSCLVKGRWLIPQVKINRDLIDYVKILAIVNSKKNLQNELREKKVSSCNYWWGLGDSMKWIDRTSTSGKALASDECPSPMSIQITFYWYLHQSFINQMCYQVCRALLINHFNHFHRFLPRFQTEHFFFNKVFSFFLILQMPWFWNCYFQNDVKLRETAAITPPSVLDHFSLKMAQLWLLFRHDVTLESSWVRFCFWCISSS